MIRPDARSFRGTLRPGPAKVVVRLQKEDEEYTVPGTEIQLWIPAPTKHEGFFGIIEHAALPYRDEEGNEYEPIFAKGAIVLLGRFTGAPVTVNNDRFIVCRESDIVAELIPETNEPTPRVIASSKISHPLDS